MTRKLQNEVWIDGHILTKTISILNESRRHTEWTGNAGKEASKLKHQASVIVLRFSLLLMANMHKGILEVFVDLISLLTRLQCRKLLPDLLNDLLQYDCCHLEKFGGERERERERERGGGGGKKSRQRFGHKFAASTLNNTQSQSRVR